jgi:hypothetical protein
MNTTPGDGMTATPATFATDARPARKQNLPLAIAAGTGAAIIGAIIWAVFTVMTNYQVGLIAIAIGFLVGYAVRLGNGVDKIFGVTGALLALLGCVLGNVLSLIGFFAKSEQVSFFSALGSIDYSVLPQVMISAFDPMDLLFYGIALYEGYRFSFRPEEASPTPAETAPAATNE